MADQVASLVVEVDASGAKKAAVDLDTLAKAADRADNAANDLADSSRKLSAAEQTVANEAKRAMEGMNHLAAEQEAVRRTSERLNQAHGTTIKNTAALNQATLNLGRQFTDIGVQLAGGQSPFLILIQQGPQVADALAMAKTQGVGLKAIIVETTVAARGLLVTFAPWIAGLAAIGGAAFLVYDAYQKQAKAIEDTTNRLKEQDKALGQISPLLSQAKTNADLAADGQRNFDEWIRKTNVSLGEQIRLQRAAALNQTNEAALKAGENLRKAQEEFDRVNRPGARSGFSTGVGGFSTISAGGAINKESELYKKAAANLKTAQADLDAVMKRLAQQGQAPDVAFGAQTESVNRATTAVRSATTATEDYRRAAAINEADLLVAAKVVWPEAAAAAEAYEKQQKSLTVVANDNIRTFEEATKGQIRFSERLEIVTYQLEDAADWSRSLRFGIEDIAYAINNNDWTSAFAGLARVLLQVQDAFKNAKTAQDKFNATAMLANAAGGAIGGTAGSALSGAASGAMLGAKLGSFVPGVGNVVGGIVGGAVGLIGGLFGGSSAKKQAKAQAAAQAAAAEAQRQQQISDTTFSLNVALLEAQGKAEEALAMTRQRELDALAKLDPALVALQQQLYAAEDAASAAAKEAEAQAQALQKEIAVRQTQRGIMLQLMALDDAVTGGNSAVLAARQDELATLDPVSQELKRIYYARVDEADALAKQTEATERAAAKAKEVADAQASIQDRINQATLTSAELMYLGREKELKAADALDASLGPMLIKLWGFEDAATKAAEATAKAADEFERLQSNQTTNIGLMRQLMAMDDAVLGTNSALLAAREDELAKLDDTGKYLQRIIWAREDEQKIIDANVAKMEAAAARAKELASRQGSIQDQIDQLTLSSSDLLLKTRAKERAEAVAFDASLGPLLDSLYSLQDAARATALANEAAAEAQRVAAEEAQRAAETYASRMTKLANLLQVSGRTSEAVLLQRAQELASIVDPVSRALQLQTYAAQDLADQIANARTALTSAYERESGAIEAFRDKLVGVGDSLRSYSATLGSTLSGSASASSQRAQAEAAFRDIVTRYQQGDVSLAGQIPALGEAFAKASQAASKDQLSYLRDIAYIKSETDMAAAKVDTQVSVAEAQLEQLKAQVNGLINVETATVSVAQAVTNLTDLIRKTTYGQDERAQAIQDQINGMQGPLGLIWSVLGYKAALAAGLPQYNGANDNLPGFATGGVFTNGIVTQPTAFNMAQMGEAGPEAIVPLVQGPDGLGVRMSGGGNAEMVAELRALRKEVAELKAAQIQTTINTGRQVRLAERWDGDGLPPERTAA